MVDLADVLSSYLTNPHVDQHERGAECAAIMRAMLDGTPYTAEGGRYRTDAVRNDPPPVQAHLPILIGGGGKKVTLKLVAKYADMNNLGNPIEPVAEADAPATVAERNGTCTVSAGASNRPTFRGF